MKRFLTLLFCFAPVLLLYGCREQSVKIDKGDVETRLQETGTAIEDIIMMVDNSEMGIYEKYELTKRATEILQQLNAAYSILCKDELSKAMLENEKVYKEAIRLSERVNMTCLKKDSDKKNNEELYKKEIESPEIIDQSHHHNTSEKRRVKNVKTNGKSVKWSDNDKEKKHQMRRMVVDN